MILVAAGHQLDFDTICDAMCMMFPDYRGAPPLFRSIVMAILSKVPARQVSNLIAREKAAVALAPVPQHHHAFGIARQHMLATG